MDMREELLREAIRLALRGMEAGEGGPFGAVVARGGEIIGRGWNRVVGANDPTAHAEIIAIRDACSRLASYSLHGCALYASCEPCPMCLAAIYWARIDFICYAASRDDAAAAGFDDRRFYEELAQPAARRSIPARQALRAEGSRPLTAWLAKPNRVAY